MSDQTPSDFIASPSQTVGPFFHFGLTANAAQGAMAGSDTPGERIRLRIRVADGAGAPVPDAMVELWQADASGRYVTTPDGPDVAVGRAFLGWGRLPTAEDGVCEFVTVRPGRPPAASGEAPAAHVNVCLFMRGLLRHLFTRIYFADDPALATDAVLGMVPPDRRDTLLARLHADGAWEFDIRLQGERETVFLDL